MRFSMKWARALYIIKNYTANPRREFTMVAKIQT